MLAQLGIRSKTTHIGLDCGATGVRAAQLRLIDGVWHVSRYARREFATAGETNGSATKEELTEITRQCVAGENFRGRDVAVAMPHHEIKFHALELPSAILTQDAETANDMARVEISRLMTATPDQVEADHWMLPSTSSAGPNAIGLGVRSQVATDTMAMCANARLSCIRADASALALHRFGCGLRRWSERQVWGMLDLGHTGSRLVLSLGTTPVLIRDVGAGGLAWTKRIAETLQIGEKAAEIQKRQHGIALTGRGIRANDGEPPSSELAGIIFGALRSLLGDLAGEIKRSYEYILSHYGIEEAGDLVLGGGGARLTNLSSYLAQSLGINAMRAGDYGDDSESTIQMTLARDTPWERLALAIGLAIDAEGATREY